MHRLSICHWGEGVGKVVVQNFIGPGRDTICKRGNESGGPLTIRADKWEHHVNRGKGEEGSGIASKRVIWAQGLIKVRRRRRHHWGCSGTGE